MLNIKVCVLTNYQCLENPALVLMMQDILLHLDTRNAVMYVNDQGVVIS